MADLTGSPGGGMRPGETAAVVPEDDAPAIILSHGTGGMGAVRSLAREGVTVFAIAFEASDVVRRSRHPSNVFVLEGSDPDMKEAQLLEVLADLPLEGAALLATSDRLVAFLSNHREVLLEKYRYAMPPKDTIDALNDKSREVAFIGSLGMSVPHTLEALPSDPEALERVLRYPMIMKPHSFEASKLFPKRHAVISDSEELAAFYAEWRGVLHAILAQEVIPGPLSNSWVCSCTYDASHELLDCMVRQKFRAIPPNFGTSTYSVCRNNQQVLDLATSLGRKLAYVGHAGLEFRWDDRDAEYKYIEMNPRIGGEVEFDQACGLPTVLNSYRVALGMTVSPSGRHQREGLVFLDFQRDMISLRTQGMSLAKIGAIQLSLAFRKTKGLYFAWDDPLPGIVVAFRFALEVWQHLVGKLARAGSRTRGATD